MSRLIAALSVLLGLILPAAALANCRGDDLRTALRPDELALTTLRLAETPYPTGNHWIATRGDDVLHLIGTMHLSDPRLDGPAARLSPIIAGAAMLLLEMNATDTKTLEQSITSDPTVFMLKDKSLPDLLTPEDWETLSAAMAARGMPAFIGARMQPWYVSMLLAVPTCLKDQLEKKDGLDHRLEQTALTHGVPTRSLEPWDTGFRLFSDIPLDMQIAMIRASLAPPSVNEDLFETLLAAYFAEAHAESQIVLEVLTPRLTALDTEETIRVYKAMDDVMITARNRNWIPELLRALEDTDGPVVAAFGAAHLAGDTGVLRLLEAEGFTLTRAQF